MRIAAVAALLQPLPFGAAAGQEARITVVAREPSVAIRNLQSGDLDSIFSGHLVASEAFRSNRSRYTVGQLKELLDGLEQTAAGDFVGSDHQVRTGMREARAVLIGLFVDSAVRGLEGKEVPERLMRIYRGSSRVDARGLALMSLGRVLCYGDANAEEIGSILVGLGKRQRATGEISPWIAVEALKTAGENGRPLLRQLHQSGEVLDPMLAAHLDRLSLADFPLNDSIQECGF